MNTELTGAARLLNLHFAQKKRAHPGASYSLRALARDLDWSQSYVSEVFAGKKRPTPERLDTLCRQLGMDAYASLQCREAYAQEAYGLPPETRAPRPARKARGANEWRPESLEDAGLLSKWLNLALLDLVDCEGFRRDPAWIGRRLGVQTSAAQASLEWLLERGYLNEDEDGRISRSQRRIRISAGKSQPEIRRLHRQMIELALQALVDPAAARSFDRRLITGITLSANPARLPEAKEILLKALHEAADLLMEGPCTEVYQINLQLFPHTSPDRG
jgi:transcriptional regulator with XRE-family HTH domain